jgi:hypothetical protein
MLSLLLRRSGAVFPTFGISFPALTMGNGGDKKLSGMLCHLGAGSAVSSELQAEKEENIGDI